MSMINDYLKLLLIDISILVFISAYTKYEYENAYNSDIYTYLLNNASKNVKLIPFFFLLFFFLN